MRREDFINKLYSAYYQEPGVSKDAIQGMLSRGFLIDEDIFLESYLANAEAFNNKLQLYLNTKDMLTAGELREFILKNYSIEISTEALNRAASSGEIDKTLVRDVTIQADAAATASGSDIRSNAEAAKLTRIQHIYLYDRKLLDIAPNLWHELSEKEKTEDEENIDELDRREDTSEETESTELKKDSVQDEPAENPTPENSSRKKNTQKKKSSKRTKSSPYPEGSAVLTLDNGNYIIISSTDSTSNSYNSADNLIAGASKASGVLSEQGLYDVVDYVKHQTGGSNFTVEYYDGKSEPKTIYGYDSNGEPVGSWSDFKSAYYSGQEIPEYNSDSVSNDAAAKYSMGLVNYSDGSHDDEFRVQTDSEGNTSVHWSAPEYAINASDSVIAAAAARAEEIAKASGYQEAKTVIDFVPVNYSGSQLSDSYSIDLDKFSEYRQKNSGNNSFYDLGYKDPSKTSQTSSWTDNAIAVPCGDGNYMVIANSNASQEDINNALKHTKEYYDGHYYCADSSYAGIGKNAMMSEAGFTEVMSYVERFSQTSGVSITKIDSDGNSQTISDSSNPASIGDILDEYYAGQTRPSDYSSDKKIQEAVGAVSAYDLVEHGYITFDDGKASIVLPAGTVFTADLYNEIKNQVADKYGIDTSNVEINSESANGNAARVEYGDIPGTAVPTPYKSGLDTPGPGYEDDDAFSEDNYGSRSGPMGFNYPGGGGEIPLLVGIGVGASGAGVSPTPINPLQVLIEQTSGYGEKTSMELKVGEDLSTDIKIDKNGVTEEVKFIGSALDAPIDTDTEGDKMMTVAEGIEKGNLPTNIIINTTDGTRLALNPEWLRANSDEFGETLGSFKIEKSAPAGQEMTLALMNLIYEAQRENEIITEAEAKKKALNIQTLLGIQPIEITEGTASNTATASTSMNVEEMLKRNSKANAQKFKDATWKGISNLESAERRKYWHGTAYGTGKETIHSAITVMSEIATLAPGSLRADLNRSINTEFLEKLAKDNKAAKLEINNNTIDLSSGKSRRTALKTIKDEVNSNKNLITIRRAGITRMSTDQLKKIQKTGKIQGVALNSSEMAIINNLLLLKGIGTGDVTAINTIALLNSKYGLKLNLKSFDLNSKDDVNKLLSQLNNLAQGAEFAGVIKGISLSSMSKREIDALLKSAQTNEKLKSILNAYNSVLKLREDKDKYGTFQTGKAQSRLRVIGRFGKRTFINGTALADGYNSIFGTIYKIRRATTTFWMVYEVIGNMAFKRRLKKLNKSADSDSPEIIKKKKELEDKIMNGSKHAQKKQARQNKRKEKVKDIKNKAKTKAANSKTASRINSAADKLGKTRFGQSMGRRFNKLKNNRASAAFRNVSDGIKKIFGKVFSAISSVKKTIFKAKVALIKFAVIAVAILCCLEFAAIGLSAASDMVTGLLYKGFWSTVITVVKDAFGNEKETEDADLDVDDSLVGDRVNYCIAMDSGLKAYIEQFYTDDKILESIKDSVKNASDSKLDEFEEWYDPLEKETLDETIDHVGTTINGINTGLHYTYYNGDGEVISMKSNAKDIVSTANAWIGSDLSKKGLYKSYVEALWNYSHAVGYSIRANDTNSGTDATTGAQKYSYVYSCDVHSDQSDCYNNTILYYCTGDDSVSERVYEHAGTKAEGNKNNYSTIHSGIDQQVYYNDSVGTYDIRDTIGNDTTAEDVKNYEFGQLTIDADDPDNDDLVARQENIAEIDNKYESSDSMSQMIDKNNVTTSNFKYSSGSGIETISMTVKGKTSNILERIQTDSQLYNGTEKGSWIWVKSDNGCDRNDTTHHNPSSGNITQSVLYYSSIGTSSLDKTSGTVFIDSSNVAYSYNKSANNRYASLVKSIVINSDDERLTFDNSVTLKPYSETAEIKFYNSKTVLENAEKEEDKCNSNNIGSVKYQTCDAFGNISTKTAFYCMGCNNCSETGNCYATATVKIPVVSYFKHTNAELDLGQSTLCSNRSYCSGTNETVGGKTIYHSFGQTSNSSCSHQKTTVVTVEETKYIDGCNDGTVGVHGTSEDVDELIDAGCNYIYSKNIGGVSASGTTYEIVPGTSVSAYVATSSVAKSGTTVSCSITSVSSNSVTATVNCSGISKSTQPQYVFLKVGNNSAYTTISSNSSPTSYSITVSGCRSCIREVETTTTRSSGSGTTSPTGTTSSSSSSGHVIYYCNCVERTIETQKTYYYCGGHCNGHETTSSTESSTHYCDYTGCLGHTILPAQEVTLNYCTGCCHGHELVEYCTGHVDLDIGVVTLYNDDINGLTELGIAGVNEGLTVTDKKYNPGAENDNDSDDKTVQCLEADTDTAPNLAISNYLFNYDDTLVKQNLSKYAFVVFNEDYSKIQEKYMIPELADTELDNAYVTNKGSTVSGTDITSNLEFLHCYLTGKGRGITNHISEENDLDGDKKITLSDIIGNYFISFATEKYHDYNDEASGNYDLSNMPSVSKKLLKNHYFSGFYQYDISSSEDGKSTAKLRMINGEAAESDNIARAEEAAKDNWYDLYMIQFPGSFNTLVEDTENKRLAYDIFYATAKAIGYNGTYKYINEIYTFNNSGDGNNANPGTGFISHYDEFGNEKTENALGLPAKAENEGTQDAIDFALEWGSTFYNALGKTDNSELGELNNTYSKLLDDEKFGIRGNMAAYKLIFDKWKTSSGSFPAWIYDAYDNNKKKAENAFTSAVTNTDDLNGIQRIKAQYIRKYLMSNENTKDYFVNGAKIERDKDNNDEFCTALTKLKAGDLVGYGNDIYLVLYNTSSLMPVTGYDDDGKPIYNTDEGENGMAKGQVILVTVSNQSSEDTDTIHAFAYSLELLSVKRNSVWLYSE